MERLPRADTFDTGLSKVNVNVNVNVEVYRLKSPWVQQTLQFTPLVLELSLLRSHHSPLGRIQRIFCSWCHSQFFQFSFHQVLITAGWKEAVWYERFLPNTSTHQLTSVILGNRLIYHVLPGLLPGFLKVFV